MDIVPCCTIATAPGISARLLSTCPSPNSGISEPGTFQSGPPSSLPGLPCPSCPPDLAPPKLNDLEVVGPQIAKGGVEFAVVPSGIASARDVEVAAVIGNDEPVRLHAEEDVADVGGIGREIFRRLEPEASAHRQ